MESEVITFTDERGGISEYKKIEEGKWLCRFNYEDWYNLKGKPPSKVLQKAARKQHGSFQATTDKAAPIRNRQKHGGLSGYKTFFIGNADWYGNKFFSSLPPSGPWIIQYVLSQIIRDTSSSRRFANAKMLELLSENHYLWANISLQNIVDRTGSSKPTVIKALNKAEELGGLISISGVRKRVDNKIYICGVKNYTKYSRGKDQQEWLFVDSHYAAEQGKFPDNLLKSIKAGVLSQNEIIDGIDLIKQLF